MRASALDLNPPLLAAPEIAPAGYRLPRCQRWWFVANKKDACARCSTVLALRWLSRRTPPTCPQRRVRVGRSAPLRRRGAEGLWPRAQRVQELTHRRCLSEAERSERSEFGDGAARLSTAAQSAYPPTAEAKRSGLHARAFAASTATGRSKVQRQQQAENQQPVARSQTPIGIKPPPLAAPHDEPQPPAIAGPAPARPPRRRSAHG